MYAAINECRSGMPLNVIGNVIHDVAASYGFRPVKNVLGHGIGTAFHMYPKVKNYRNSDDTIELQPGMVITIEPALVEGHHAYVTWDDGWTNCTVDGGLAAQFEHTVLISDSVPEIQTEAQSIA